METSNVLGAVEEDDFFSVADGEAQYFRWVDAIHPTDLEDLLAGRCIGLGVKNWFEPDLCAAKAEIIKSHPLIGGYSVDHELKRLGTSFYDTANDPALLEAYFAHAFETMREMRRLWHPYLSPIDEMRLELQEVWASGGAIAEIGGRQMLAGTARIFGEKPVEAHVDSLGFDASRFADAPRLVSQISCNTYLEVAPVGGELVIWPNRVETAEQEAALRLPGHNYALDESLLGEPAVEVKPIPGMAILFDTRCPHAVRASSGPRVSMSLFAGWRGDHRSPLVFWN